MSCLTTIDAAGRTRNRRGQFAKAVSAPPPMLDWFRLTVFDKPRGPWLESREMVMAWALKHELASWDASRREHYLAVPVSIERRQATTMPVD